MWSSCRFLLTSTSDPRSSLQAYAGVTQIPTIQSSKQNSTSSAIRKALLFYLPIKAVESPPCSSLKTRSLLYHPTTHLVYWTHPVLSPPGPSTSRQTRQSVAVLLSCVMILLPLVARQGLYLFERRGPVGTAHGTKGRSMRRSYVYLQPV